MNQKLLSRTAIIELFQDLEAKLIEQGIAAQVFVVGGAAMSLAYKADRVTRDVDAIFKPATELRKIIAEVAVENDLDEDWLNDGAKGFMPGTDADAVAFYESDNLSVYVASKPYLLAMKLHAGRDQRDRDDAILLARLLGYTNYEQLSDLLVKYFSGRLQPKHRYLALEIASELSAGDDSAAQAKQG